MKARPNGAVIALVVAFAFVSIVVGRLATQLEPEWLIAGVFGAIAVGLVFYDYRVGVVCLTFLLPWCNSPIVPQTRGFNLINFLFLAAVVSLVLNRFRKESVVPLPRVVLLCYLLPFAVAAVLAWPHLSVGSANFPPRLTGLEDGYAPFAFLKGRVIKPLFFVLYAFLLANAVRDSKRPERFFLAFGMSSVIPALAIISEIMSGVDVTDRKNFLAGLGLQANEYGMLLSLAVGPLLFIAAGSGPRSARVAAGVAFSVVSPALFLTASRGAVVAYIVVIAAWLLKRRKLSDLFVGAIVATALVLVMPSQVQDRLTQGLEGAGESDHREGSDELTMGRGYIWEKLAPDIQLSPFWGRGLGSTAWNTATSPGGRVWVGHPHSIYLEVLLDIGIFGFAAIAYLYYRYARAFRALSREPSSSPLSRDYFAGAYAAFLGMLAFGITNGHYFPHPEQSYLWFALGFAFAYWHLSQGSGSPVRRKPFGLGVKHAPLPRAER